MVNENSKVLKKDRWFYSSSKNVQIFMNYYERIATDCQQASANLFIE